MFSKSLRRQDLDQFSKIYAAANVSYIIHFIRRGATASYNSYLKGMRSPKIPWIALWCELPDDVYPTLSARVVTDEIMSTHFAIISGMVDPNPWHKMLTSTSYHILFRYLEPLLNIINAVASFRVIIRILLQVYGELNSSESYWGTFVEHRGGRSSVLVLLLTIEFAIATTLAVSMFLICNFCDKSAVDLGISNILMLRFIFSSIGTMVLAGTFWQNRRKSLEKVLSFAQVDDRAYFHRYKKVCVISAFFLLGLDFIASVLMLYIRIMQFIIGLACLIFWGSLSLYFFFTNKKIFTYNSRPFSSSTAIEGVPQSSMRGLSTDEASYGLV